MKVATALSTIPLFEGLDESQLNLLLSAMRELRLPQGNAILREGEQGDSMFILTRGAVAVTKRLGLAVATPADGAKEKTLVRLKAPQFFGEMGLLEGSERSATVTATEECTVLELGKSVFTRLATEDPLMGYVVVRNIAIVLSSRLRRSDRDVVKLTMALSLALGNR